MDLIRQFFQSVYNVPELIRLGGLFGMVVVVFAETGLLVGFFLPGDSLLLTAGVLVAAGEFKVDILWLNIALMLAAIAGDATGYWIGRRAGTAIYSRPDSFLFRRKHLVAAHEFYERHGGKTIVLARFMPIIRTFAPVVAGAAEMSYWRFASYNVFGGIGWVASMTLAGYFLGRSVPDIDKNLHLVVAVVIFLSLLPAVIGYLRSRFRTKGAKTPVAGPPLATPKE